MLFDHINHYTRYNNLNDNIKAALDFIYTHRIDETIEDGRYEIIPDQVIAYVVSKDTITISKAGMEIHKKFMDIHYMLKGQERCGMMPLPKDSDKASYDEEGDIAFFDQGDDSSILVHQGEFYAVWPYEPHRPLCSVEDKSEKVRKIICKVIV